MRHSMKNLLGVAATMLGLVGSPASAETIVTVSNSAQLTSAIGTIADGGVIELLSGTYAAPSGGFQILNPSRSFTIRAAASGTVFLDGGGSRPVLLFQAASHAQRGWVSFEGLVFSNGYSTQPSRAAGVSLFDVGATFVDCEFMGNDARPSSGGGNSGALGVSDGSEVLLIGCVFLDNTSIGNGAAMVITGHSEVTVHDSQFLGNRNNIPDHIPNAMGGAIVLSNGVLRAANTRFEANEAGFCGGAVAGKGTWTEPESEVVLSNCTFVDNLAQPDPRVTTNSPPCGGAVAGEDHVAVAIHNCRFLTNSAEFGGALSLYRPVVEIHSSVFRGNRAVASATAGGRGGAIHAISSDTSIDGSTNRRPVSVTVSDSLFQGRYGAVSATAQSGGAIHAEGDTNRMYGQGGVSQGGSLAMNRAVLDITGSVFHDCDADQSVSGSTMGGAIFGALVDLRTDESLFMDCDATGSQGWGGAGAFITQSVVGVSGTTFAVNSADHRGGALILVGSTAAVTGSTFIGNEVSPGESEPESTSLGAAIFSAPQEGLGLGVNGTVQGSTFCSDVGMTAYDDDRFDGTGHYNLVQYNGNTFYNTTFGQRVYVDNVVGGSGRTPAQLNALVVDRGGGNTTDKAPNNNNQQAGAEPIRGILLAVPQSIIPRTAAGDGSSETESFLGYAWCGGDATLDGQTVTGNRGLVGAEVGQHVLRVASRDTQTSVGQVALPEAVLTADPVFIPRGGQTTLEWMTTGGTFLDSRLDWELSTGGSATGSVVVTPPGTRTYRFHALTAEGGTLAAATVYVDEQPPDEIFSDDFESGNLSAWSGAVQ